MLKIIINFISLVKEKIKSGFFHSSFILLCFTRNSITCQEKNQLLVLPLYNSCPMLNFSEADCKNRAAGLVTVDTAITKGTSFDTARARIILTWKKSASLRRQMDGEMILLSKYFHAKQISPSAAGIKLERLF